jgi:uncharacterized protein YaiI (UPF0178 family)
VTIWVDADAAPGEMKDVVFRAAKRLSLDVVLVANKSLFVPVAYPTVRSVCVSGGPDAADHHIVQNAVAGDLAVTADVELAARLVQNSVAVVDPRGHEYTANDVGASLAARNFMEELRGAGVKTAGPPPYGPRDKQSFAATLDRVLTKVVRGRR